MKTSSFPIQEMLLQAAVLTIELLKPVGGALRTAADQGIRASSSAYTQGVEAFGRQGRDRAHRLRTCYAECGEAAGVLRLFQRLGDVDADAATDAMAYWDSARAMIWRHQHPKR
jgi:hypothetical protein